MEVLTMIIPVNASDEEIEKLLTQSENASQKVREQTESPKAPQPKQQPTSPTEATPTRPVSADEQPQVYYWGNLFFFDWPIIRRDYNAITFHALVTKDSVEELKSAMSNAIPEIMRSYANIGITDVSQMELKLFIDSGGGSIPDGFDLIDFIDKYPIPVTTIGTGTVASMAVPILLAGKKRYLTANSHVLIHQFRAGFYGKRQDILDMLKHLEKVHDQLVGFISSRTKLSKKDVDEMMKSETWLTAKEAIEYGIADEIY